MCIGAGSFHKMRNASNLVDEVEEPYEHRLEPRHALGVGAQRLPQLERVSENVHLPALQAINRVNQAQAPAAV